MGNNLSGSEDFIHRNDIAEYQISIDDRTVWNGSSVDFSL
jgi:predicted kinase